jgi:DNA-binding NtrC family response regulator
VASPGLAVEVAVALSSLALQRRDLRVAAARLGEAGEWVSDERSRAAGLVGVARAELASASQDEALARVHLLAATRAFAALGHRRDEGRALLRLAEIIGASAPGRTEEQAAGWFGRAQSTLGALATHRDRARLREGFRLHGRRLPDAALSLALVRSLDGAERAAAALLDGLGARACDEASRVEMDPGQAALADALDSLPGALAPFAAELDRALLALAEAVTEPRGQRVSVPPASRAPARVRYQFADLVGSSPGLREAIEVARQAARVDAGVLITGESGTGKEVLAQAIHGASERAGHPFVGVNCAALPRDLLESELFGYERGAFTGARSEGSAGKFEQAGEGTILLDEIGDMPLDMQVKLLRVLQERVVVRLGGTRERPLPARVIATTHRDLDEAVDRGNFRLDLLFRLRVLPIHLPALRQRPEDIPAIAAHYLQRIAAAQRRPPPRLGPAVQRALLAYSWPGNVRELANVIERELSLLPPEATSLDRIQGPLGRPASLPALAVEIPAPRPSAPVGLSGDSGSFPAVISAAQAAILPLVEVERRAYLDAFQAFNGHVPRAARALGVSKVTFYAKLRQWGLHPSDEPGPETLRSIRLAEQPPDKGGGRDPGR